jgi:hypothetical protein
MNESIISHTDETGNKMESRADLVRGISLPKRRGDSVANSLDSILYFSTILMMLGIYIYIVLIDQNVVT